MVFGESYDWCACFGYRDRFSRRQNLDFAYLDHFPALESFEIGFDQAKLLSRRTDDDDLELLPDRLCFEVRYRLSNYLVDVGCDDDDRHGGIMIHILFSPGGPKESISRAKGAVGMMEL